MPPLTVDARRAEALMAELQLAFPAAQNDPRQWVLVERLASALVVRAGLLADTTLRQLGAE